MKDLPRKIFSLAANPLSQRGQQAERVALDFERAHRRAFMQDALKLVRYEPTDLLPFEEVRAKLRLGSKFYAGIQAIPLDQIVGSVSRYEDFTRTFMPRKASTRQRWESVEKLADSRGWLPVEVYRVSDTYFVRDGNHRVSVARQMELETIEAHVWEYPTRVPLEADDDLDDLLLRAEYLEFLDDTHLDQLRSDHQPIILTIPGGYWELENQIAIYRHWLSLEQRRELTWPEAVAHWYDTVYVPLVQKTQDEEILALFPGRTAADLVVWILRHQEKLERRYGGEEVPPSEAAADFVERQRANPLRRLRAWIERKFLGKPVS
ncbi:MAG: transcriptional regulator [Chloroflexota bacterium]